MRILLLCLFFLALNTFSIAQDIRINELMSSNVDALYDEDDQTPDWIELNNFGTTTLNLGAYFLSDNLDDLEKWQLPTTSLAPNNQFLIFASNKNRDQVPLFWYTLIDMGDDWKYFIPSAPIVSGWNMTSFNDNSWSTGPSSIGYGDEDDATTISNGALSVFMRRKFSIDDLEGLASLWLHMDYDDAFVAHLNGVEIARGNFDNAGATVGYNQTPNTDHEANIYRGLEPEAFDVSAMINLLQEGDNVLAVQVHNTGVGSSDFTAIPFLTLGYESEMNIGEDLSDYVDLVTLYPHSNFRLSSSGETVYLSHPTEGIVDSIAFSNIPGDYSYGRHIDDPDNLVYFEESTPAAPNGTPSFTGVVTSEVVFSIEETHLTGSQDLELSGAQAGESVYYTLDGEEPTLSSDLYNDPITLSENTVVRARIFRPDAIPGKMATRTYLFDAEHDLPIVSITTAPDNLWDEETGIYVLGTEYDSNFPFFGANFWEDWERPAHIELVEPTGERAFSVNAGIKIFGGWSRGNPQKSLSVFMRNGYGDQEINYQIFQDKNINTFQSLTLRNSGNDWNRSMMRDGMLTSLVKDLNLERGAYRPAVLYINGEYWGIQNIREKINEDFIASNHGIDADSIDMLEFNAGILEGSNAHYLDLLDFMQFANMANNANYQVVTDKIDVDNFIDYQVAQIYFNNHDWPGNNIKYWRPQKSDGKWRWILFDTDFGFGIWNPLSYQNNTLQFATATDGPGWPNPPWSTFMLRRLLANQDFQHDFINRFADLLNTTFKGNEVNNHIDSLAANIESEIPDHLDRWPTASFGDWEYEIDVLRNFASNRVVHVRNHIRGHFALPAQHQITLEMQPSDGGFIALNSLEIRENNWTGIYFQTVPIKLSAMPFTGYDFDRWEVNGVVMDTETIELDIDENTLIQLFWTPNGEDNDIVINEINYNSPMDNDAHDWIELFNRGEETINLSNWVLRDDDDTHEFIFPEGTQLGSWEYLVVVQDEEDFLDIHPTVLNYIGEFNFGYGNGGDAVRLFNQNNELEDIVEYGVENPWPDAPNISGVPIELIYYNYDNALPQSWWAAQVPLGTPGTGNTSTNVTADLFFKYDLEIFPNPFGNFTRIALNRDYAEPINLEIFTLKGQMVVSERWSENEFLWDGRDENGNELPSGIYLCKVQSDQGFHLGRIVLQRNSR